MTSPDRNIVFVVRNLALGGIPRVVIELCRSWSDEHPEDDVHLVLLDDHDRHYDTPDNVTEHDLTRLLNDLPGKMVRAGNRLIPNLCSVLTMGRNTRALNRWARDLERRSGARVDLMLCGYGAISSFWPSKLHNVVCVAHNLYAAMLEERTGRFAEGNKRLLRKALRGVPVYGISTPIRDTLRRDIGAEVMDKVLYNPVDAQRIRRMAAEAAPHEVIPSPYVLYLGRLSPEKNVDAIIRAFGAMTTITEPVLAIAGAGSERAQLEKLAAAQPRPVRFLGSVKNPYPAIAGASALVLASDFEGMPTVLLEARALGTPIVTTPAGGASTEAIEGYDAAVLVPAADPAALSAALSALFDNPPGSSHAVPDDLAGFSTRACISRYREVLNAATE
ncbi:MAG: glycosyltransferase [Rhodobacteraceae bacterium]|nr:glycosyltransferase [Paracoccaceae bacterium]